MAFLVGYERNEETPSSSGIRTQLVGNRCRRQGVGARAQMRGCDAGTVSRENEDRVSNVSGRILVIAVCLVLFPTSCV